MTSCAKGQRVTNQPPVPPREESIMRSFYFSLVLGVASLLLLGTAPAAVNAQRIRIMPVAAPRAVVPVNRAFVPQLGVMPSQFVVPVTVYPYSPRTGTFSAVGVSSGFAFPTYTSSFPTYGSAYNSYLASVVTASYYRTYYGAYANPYAIYSSTYYNPYLSTAYSNSYMTSYYNPYMMY